MKGESNRVTAQCNYLWCRTNADGWYACLLWFWFCLCILTGDLAGLLWWAVGGKNDTLQLVSWLVDLFVIYLVICISSSFEPHPVSSPGISEFSWNFPCFDDRVMSSMCTTPFINKTAETCLTLRARFSRTNKNESSPTF